MKAFVLAVALAGSMGVAALPAAAGQPNQADTNHPGIHGNVGGGGDGPRANANPNDANDRGGNIHGIGNTPGQSGTNPNDDGEHGFANQLGDVHGGIGDVNQNVDD